MKWLNMTNWACIGGIHSVDRILVEKLQERNILETWVCVGG